MKNRLNRYVHLIANGDNSILFNIANNRILVLRKELVQILYDCKESGDIDHLSEIHPELYASMVDAWMIVPQNLNEAEKLIESWKLTDDDPSFFGMIINPTLSCNMSCWYCYEKHDTGLYMDKNIIQSVYRLIDNKIANDRLKRLNVSFFGGEPLLNFKNVVYPLLSYASAKCHKKGVHLNSNFTTNAVLLTSDVLNKLNSLNMATPPSFQITLDGNKDIHDKVRYTVGHIGSYDVILEHIRQAVTSGCTVNIRFNYTANNVDSFLDTATDLDRFFTAEQKKLVNMNFQQIWQDQHIHPEAKEKMLEVAEKIRSIGFYVDSDMMYSRHVCYADNPNHVVINYDGNVYKCTARDFKENNKEGILLPDGTIEWNEKFHKRMSIRFDNKACINCSILPLCNGGCSQGKLDSGMDGRCRFGKDENDKRHIIVGRLRQLVKESNKKLCITK